MRKFSAITGDMVFLDNLSVVTLILLVTFFQFILILILWLDIKNKSNRVSAGLIFILNINFAMQVWIPSFVGVFYGYSLESQFGIKTNEIFYTVLIHLIYLTCFIVTFKYDELVQLMVVKKRIRICDFSPKNTNVKVNDPILITLVLIGFILLWGKSGFSTSSIEWSKCMVFIYLQTMFEWSSIIAAIIILCFGGKLLAKFFSITLILFTQLFLVSQGLRGGVLMLVILVPFYLYIRNGKIPLGLLLIFSLSIMPFFSYLGGDFRNKLQNELLITAPVERLVFIMEDGFAHGNGVSFEVSDWVFKIYKRLEATRNSVCLIRLNDEGLGVSLRPTISSLFSLVPARVWPEKYYPTSSRGDLRSTAMYVVKAETYGTTDMGPFLSSAHEYWEGGILYTLFSAFIVACFWRQVCIRFQFSRYGVLILLVVGGGLDAHHGELSVVAPLSHIIKVFFYQIIPLLFLFYFIRFIKSLRWVK